MATDQPLPNRPMYLERLGPEALAVRARDAVARLSDCDLCARYCHADRTVTTKGAVCRTGRHAVVSSHFPHHGEEACLSGWNGSGTIFFAWCDMRCVYCQNWELSWEGEGTAIGPERLAAIMLDLQRRGCHNINLVNPSHVVAQVLEALAIAVPEGLRLPIVYNTGGYDSLEALALLDGVVDIYMPDAKYADEAVARRYSKVRDYPVINQAAMVEMHRQVGDLVIGADGLARRGVLVRHLVLPNGIAGTGEVMQFLAERLSPATYVNVMAQYRPCHRAHAYPELARRMDMGTYRDAVKSAQRAGLSRIDGLVG